MQVHINRKRAQDLGLPIPKEGGNVPLYDVRLAGELAEDHQADEMLLRTISQQREEIFRLRKEGAEATVLLVEVKAELAARASQPTPTERAQTPPAAGPTHGSDAATPQGRRRH
jgi:hypothetical protein